jgi:dTDP-4-amino-4,6-dideoxygalactose transaminase
MNYSKIWLSSPHMSGKELKYIHAAFEGNWVAPLGPNINQLELDLENYLDCNTHVAALSSGTAALHLALVILGVKAGDEVICQSKTFAASAFPISYLGALPVFVDSEEDTWNMCPNGLRETLKDRIKKGNKPKAIIVVDLYGMPAKMDEIVEVANFYEIPLIEDAAEALGSSYKNRKCGTFGDLAILSFNGNKVITTSGGGALISKSLVQKTKALYLSTQARDNTIHYQHSEIGYNYRMSNISAGIGCGQIEVLEERLAQRRRNFEVYEDLFKDKPGVKMLSEPSSDFYSNHWLSAILIDEKITGFTNLEMIAKLAEYNIESRQLWKPMHLQPVFSGAPYYGGTVAEDLYNKGLCLPSGSNLTPEDLARIKKVIECCFSPKKNK